MNKIIAEIVTVAIVFILSVVLFGYIDSTNETSANAQARNSTINSMLQDSTNTPGSAVRSYMTMAAGQGAGYLVTGTGGMTSSTTNGAVQFNQSGSFASGKVYVVVNYLADGSGTYTQTTDTTAVPENAVFKKVTLNDSTGKPNRYTFTQVNK